MVGNLERESIDLAHVWPKTYPSLQPGKEKTCCYWFVGLVIKQQQPSAEQQQQQLDLTTPIKKFTDLVMGTAMTIKRWVRKLGLAGGSILTRLSTFFLFSLLIAVFFLLFC